MKQVGHNFTPIFDTQSLTVNGVISGLSSTQFQFTVHCLFMKKKLEEYFTHLYITHKRSKVLLAAKEVAAP
jgi:hypothetical protein